MYIRAFMPAGQMSFHVYHRQEGVVETVAHATPEGGQAMAIRSQLSPRGRQQVAAQRSIRVRVIDRLGDDPVTSPVAGQLGALDLSGVVMDLVLEKKMLGVFSVFNNGREKFNPSHVRLLSLLNEPCAVALTNSLRYRELMALRDLLADDNRYLQRRMMEMTGDTIIGANFGLREVMKMVRQVAGLNVPVLLLGETGVGKEVIANTLHHSSERKGHPFIKINCGAIPENLIDSELFGHEKGAFTGAVARKRGRFERAHTGTIFLDEIGELPPAAQVRLLRVLQHQEIERVGGTETIPIDVRLISATHRNLEEMVAAGRFREDLWFRLNLFPIQIPPLRERAGDIPALVRYFIERKARDLKLRRLPALAEDVLEGLQSYHWPGNVRELENLVERGLILNQMSDGASPLRLALEQKCVVDAPVASLEAGISEPRPLETVMGEHIRKTLDWTQGRVEGPGGAARILGLHPSTLRGRMRKLGIPHGRKAGAVRRSG
jgi:transcriptional regulator with GAF, ATPase, and Fis domain